MMVAGAPQILQQVLEVGVAIREILTIMCRIKAAEFAKRRDTSQEIARKKANKKKDALSVVKKAIIKPIVQALEETIEKEDVLNVAKKATTKQIALKQMTVKKI